MRSIELKPLRKLLRTNFGGLEVRENKKCITVTFMEGGFLSKEAAEGAVNFFLRDHIDLTAVGVSSTRVHLFEKLTKGAQQDLPLSTSEDSIDDIDFVEGVDYDTVVAEVISDEEYYDLFGIDSDEEFTDEDLANLEDLIESTVATAHEESQLEVLLTKKLDCEIEEFLTGNLSTALELLPDDVGCVTTDELKKVLVFAYLSGKWTSARMDEIEFLMRYFDNRFKFAAEEYGNG